MKIQLLNKKIGLVSFQKEKVSSGFYMPTDNRTYKIIKFIDPTLETSLKEGDKVIIGPRTETVNIDGEDVIITDESNIFAKIND